MPETPPVPALLDQMRQFAENVHRALTGADVHWMWQPDSGEWSLTQVICHLRDVEREVHRPRFDALIAHENAFISGVTPDEWAVPRNYQAQNGPTALADFYAARTQTVAMLRALDDAMWRRRGRHAFFGPTTMHELLTLVVRHDAAHWEQITALLAQAH
ncbi:MAG: DinB family protein [Anaerolineales bacterium]|nr:DinB family protein [Anaerolineales bacterium]MCB8950907.1 DinB family protein [Ardenticatenales bacterium]